MSQPFSTSPVKPGLHAARGDTPLLERVRLVGSLAGPLLELAVEQQFCNRTPESVELVYSFPMPWGAVLLELEVRLGDKLLTGGVAPRARAEALYESALDDGDAAVLLQQTDDGGCTLNLGNLAPGERCSIQYRFAQLLRLDRGSLRLMLPTVLAPRCGAQHALDPGCKPAPDLLADYPMDLELTLDAALCQGRIASPSHPIRVALAAGRATISLARLGHLDRDFVLVVDQLPQVSTLVLGADPVQTGQVAVLTSFALPAGTPKAPISAKLLLDCSSSMAGDSIAAAREALASCLDQLQSGDRVTLSDFGDQTFHFTSRWLSPGVAALASARRWVMTRKAILGGTQMTRALTAVFGLCGAEPADVLLITDGQIENLAEAVEAARRSRHRVFAVGIGAAPVEALLRQLAEATGGACEFVAGGEDVQPAVQRLFARLRSERIEALRCDWSLSAGQLVWSAATTAQPPWAGDTVKFMLRFDGQPRGRAAFSWQDGAGRHELALELPTQVQTSGALARMAAAMACQSLPEAEATELALRYRLLTRHTHWVMVHRRAAQDKARLLPSLKTVRPMLAAGWGATGSVTAGAVSDHSRLSTPSVWRSGRTLAAAKVDALTSQGMDEIEIPAFLRKQADAPEVSRAVPPLSMPVAITQQGITPQALRFWLLRRQTSTWPQTLAELDALGLPQAWRDWLQSLIAPGLDIAQAVRAFLLALALSREAGRSASGPDLPSRFGRLIGGRDGDSDLQQLVARHPRLASIRPALASVQPQAWGAPPAAQGLAFGAGAGRSAS